VLWLISGLNILRNRMFTKTVDSITKVFTQAIKDLQELETQEQAKINRYNKVIQDAKDASTIAQIEIKRAGDVRTKLQSIVS
jgi:hypothetical protein